MLSFFCGDMKERAYWEVCGLPIFIAINITCTDNKKVIQKGAFPNGNAPFKSIIFANQELETKWDGGHIQNCAMVMNQLLVHENL